MSQYKFLWVIPESMQRDMRPQMLVIQKGFPTAENVTVGNYDEAISLLEGGAFDLVFSTSVIGRDSRDLNPQTFMQFIEICAPAQQGPKWCANNLNGLLLAWLLTHQRTPGVPVIAFNSVGVGAEFHTAITATAKHRGISQSAPLKILDMPFSNVTVLGEMVYEMLGNNE